MTEVRVALLIRIRKELKGRLADIAKQENRSLNQQIEFLLAQAIEPESADRKPAGRQKDK